MRDRELISLQGRVNRLFRLHEGKRTFSADGTKTKLTADEERARADIASWAFEEEEVDVTNLDVSHPEFQEAFVDVVYNVAYQQGRQGGDLDALRKKFAHIMKLAKKLRMTAQITNSFEGGYKDGAASMK